MFDSLDALLRRSLRRHRLTSSVTASQMLERVNQILGEIFGDGILRKAQAITVRGTCITIACTSPVLASEIRLQEQKILRKLDRGEVTFQYRLR